ncbi:MAG: alpha-N-arabinofuranosidase [Planctomycetota bacterium]|nr:alpha-N-arabinofuranosidase [Planctomycetota bacterium]
MSNARIAVSLDQPIATINPNIYGHFAEHLGACIYEGVWVGEKSPIPNTGGMRNDVITALKKIAPPVVRWPGGCFADDYHWEDGIGPRANRPRRINVWWGDAIETNEFGTHEFVRFCDLIGAEPYICGNVGSGSPRELRNWAEYCNFAGDSTLARARAANGHAEPFRAKFWGVGNENWGCGGHFSAEDYAKEYKRFSTYLRDFSDNKLCLVACGPAGNNPDWTRKFFSTLGTYHRIHGFAAHYYCGTAGTATEYTVDEWYHLLWRSLEMETLVRQQRATMDSFDPERKIGLFVDEWGTWHPAAKGRNPAYLWQQNTLRDALVAALTLDIFNRHADKVVIGNIAQTVNVLQAMILTDGAKMLTTPTYHVYDMYQAHQGGQSVWMACEAEGITFQSGGKNQRLPSLCGSASLKKKVLTLSIVNTHATNTVEAAMELRGARCQEATVTELVHTDIHAHNTFDAPETVKPRTRKLQVSGPEWRYAFPPASVTVFNVPL